MAIKNELSGKSGIYGIINQINFKVYVGRTSDLSRRFSQYKYDFKCRHIGHINDYLYNSMIKYGYENFTFTPLQFCSIDECKELELFWMIKLKSTDRKFGYNLRLDTDGGMIVSKETSAKITSNLKAQWASGVREQHSQKLKDSWADDVERKTKQSDMLRAIKTKFKYTISNDSIFISNLDYRGITEYGLSSVLSNFHRRGVYEGEVMCKGFLVKRELI